ncbi:ShlB/FhaC/HecB family hemolysin secretion/activation protein [Stanieria cyanosphaera]|nr:ShlB/FhaC/HecB family hemolysin secretion/activation protein [Stanieria cyanosphaera]
MTVSGSSLATVFTIASTTKAQSPPEKIPPNTPNIIEQTIPKRSPRLTPPSPDSSPTPNFQIPNASQPSQCVSSTTGDLAPSEQRSDRSRILVKKIEVLGNTVLQSQIEREVQKLENRRVTFEDLICLRSKITQLYLNQGYVTSGAFLLNNSYLNSGIIQIQVIEGKLEKIEIKGLKRLRQDYIRNRLQLATKTPLNRYQLENGLKLLLLDPLIERLSAELTAGKTPGRNILILDLQESPTFQAGIGGDNYRPSSVGSAQFSIFASQNNLLGFGDRLSGEYGITEGLDIYNFNYSIPLNSHNGTLSFGYDNSDSRIIEDRFRDLNIKSRTRSFSLSFRQPFYKTPNTEFAIALGLDLRRSKSFLLGEPFSFSEGAEDGKSNVTAIRFSQDWLDRKTNSVLAARSQFSFGIDAFDATVNNTGTDGQFFAWLGQFQWVRQLSSGTLLVTRINGQLTPDSLLSIEKFSLGGINTVRGYPENQLVTDNGVSGSVELRFPLTSNSSIQLIPFVEAGTGWNNREPNPNHSTLASFGLGINWSITNNFRLQIDYGIPLIAVERSQKSLQEDGLHFSLNYQPF